MIINKAQITKIEIYHKARYTSAEYRPKTRFLWFTLSEAGFYYSFGTFFPPDKIEKADLFVEEYKLFHKPHLDIYTSDGGCVSKYFETVDELYTFIKDELGDLDVIEVKQQ